MITAHTVDQVRAAETALMATLPDGALMQRAASGLAVACVDLLRRAGQRRGGQRPGGQRRGGPGVYGARAVLLVGSGDNGGDALWAGARLARRGVRVDAVLIRHDRVHQDGLRAFTAAGGRVVSAADAAATPAAVAALAAADLIVDGMLGIGSRGGLRPDAAKLAALAAAGPGRVIAVDLPSGIEPDTGETPGGCVHADRTVTFGTYKTGLLVDPAAAAAGHTVLVDIGLGPYLPAPAVQVLERGDVAGLLPRADRTSDKYRRGVVGVLAGSATYAGAAVLATGGALRSGAGMVRFAGPGETASAVLEAWPEVVGSPDVERTGRVQAWTVGSGLGDGRRGGRRDEVRAVLASGVPVLVDADGLRDLPERFDGPALLTPHAGELARMLGVDRSDVEASRLRHVTDAARRWNATVLLKGFTTLVASPSGLIRANPTGTPALATAGSGDVLAGICGTLLAAGLSPLDAGSVGAYLHGRAGASAAATNGQPAAQDVLGAVPGVLADLLRRGAFSTARAPV